MRIVGGRLKGRKLAVPAGDAIRPTTDRARESLFNIIEHRYAGRLEKSRVLDLFAGTGAVGMEALSRGASYAHFVDTSAMARGLIRTNLETLALVGSAKIYRRDATNLGPVGTLKPFDIVFLDPPYRRDFGEAAILSAKEGGWLMPGSLAIWEEAADAEVRLPDGFQLDNERRFGDTIMRFLLCA